MMPLKPKRSRRCQLHRRFIIHRPYVSILLAAALLSAIVASASTIEMCERDKCIPNCACDHKYDEDCAIDYGNYGWPVPENANEHMYHYVRPESPRIWPYEIKPAGMRTEGEDGIGRGMGQVLTIQEEGLVGQVYFEVHPDRLNHDRKSNDIVVELYGDTEFGSLDCGNHGKLLSKSALVQSQNIFEHHRDESREEQQLPDGKQGFSWAIFPFPSYNDAFRHQSMECHPRTKGAIMAAAEFTIPDPFSTSNDGVIWFPQWIEGKKQYKKEGILQYCVRVVVQPPEGLSASSSGYSYIDTTFRIEGDRREDNFGHTSQRDVLIRSNQAIESKEAYTKTKEIPVEAYMCDYPSRSADTLPRFGLGEEFSICVRSAKDFVSDYKITGFESVVCSNEGGTRELINEGFVVDSMAVIANNNGEIDTVDGTTTVQPGSVGFQTNVTIEWLQEREDTLRCTGKVGIVEWGSTRRRGLIERGYLVSSFEFDVRLFDSIGAAEEAARTKKMLMIGFSPILIAVVVGLLLWWLHKKCKNWCQGWARLSAASSGANRESDSDSDKSKEGLLLRLYTKFENKIIELWEPKPKSQVKFITFKDEIESSEFIDITQSDNEESDCEQNDDESDASSDLESDWESVCMSENSAESDDESSAKSDDDTSEMWTSYQRQLKSWL